MNCTSLAGDRPHTQGGPSDRIQKCGLHPSSFIRAVGRVSPNNKTSDSSITSRSGNLGDGCAIPLSPGGTSKPFLTQQPHSPTAMMLRLQSGRSGRFSENGAASALCPSRPATSQRARFSSASGSVPNPGENGSSPPSRPVTSQRARFLSSSGSFPTRVGGDECGLNGSPSSLIGTLGGIASIWKPSPAIERLNAISRIKERVNASARGDRANQGGQTVSVSPTAVENVRDCTASPVSSLFGSPLGSPTAYSAESSFSTFSGKTGMSPGGRWAHVYAPHPLFVLNGDYSV